MLPNRFLNIQRNRVLREVRKVFQQFFPSSFSHASLVSVQRGTGARRNFGISRMKRFHYSSPAVSRSDSNLEGMTPRNVISSAALIAKPYDALCRLSIKYAMQPP